LWGLLDQAVVSGVNFVTIVVMARALQPAEFGYFVLAFTVIQTTLTLQAALITRPHNVLGAVRHGDAYVNYSTSAATLQLGFTTLVATSVAAVAGVAYAAGVSRALLFLALVPALVMWQLQELGRRMLYTENRLDGAFANDVLSYGCQTVALVVLWRLGELTGIHGLLALAVCFAIGAATVAWQLRASLSGRIDASSLAANWHFGKWLGAAEVGQWFSTQFYIYLAGALVGAVASGVLKAGQTLLGPMAVFLTFVTSYLPIVFAREHKRTGTIASELRRSFIVVLPVVALYCIVISLFARPVLDFVYGQEYGRYTDVVRLFAVYYLLLALSTIVVAALSAQGLTRDVFVGQAAGAALSLAIGWILLQQIGAEGGVIGMLASWAVAMTLFTRALRAAAVGRRTAVVQ
jgi:O-antigen/teichoic acid export membrane protein